jgi:hypothetical protein
MSTLFKWKYGSSQSERFPSRYALYTSVCVWISDNYDRDGCWHVWNCKAVLLIMEFCVEWVQSTVNERPAVQTLLHVCLSDFVSFWTL